MALYFRCSLWEAVDKMRLKKGQNSKAELFYLSVIKKKTAKEKLKMLDEFFKFAKSINPEFFKCPQKGA